MSDQPDDAALVTQIEDWFSGGGPLASDDVAEALLRSCLAALKDRAICQCGDHVRGKGALCAVCALKAETTLKGLQEALEWEAALKKALLPYQERAIRAEAVLKGQTWQPIETAPKGVWAKLTTDPAWVEPPHILACYEDGRHMAVVYWDWYYAEGGNGYEPGRTAWIEVGSCERAAEYGRLTHWMPLPAPPASTPEER